MVHAPTPGGQRVKQADAGGRLFYREHVVDASTSLTCMIADPQTGCGLRTEPLVDCDPRTVRGQLHAAAERRLSFASHVLHSFFLLVDSN